MVTTRRPGAYVCGIDAAMDVIGGKWKVLILWELGVKPCRFGELRRGLPGVTEKVLASHLRELEADGIVHRETYDEVPPRVSTRSPLAAPRSTPRWSPSGGGAASTCWARRPRGSR
ncbi:HxlR family transcriptional regulator [Saccharopolyspora erythraea NRRL 2338]|uniref:Transcriptional regulator n=2 Tax=Saccharopolyspora erythraea TaxID=1836 RepID=A4F9H7_SACEN|nr:HxlR family transcriptional regulator [Saccharopolyspora erythraea NRRL 2338]QRK91243.1 winged helix-turn-helix transcriptional regulator [Saccharopolyspora erythraea]CAM00702.1 transcriptional regulator [Saccharopolyspora erythraea NRRL 2338]